MVLKSQSLFKSFYLQDPNAGWPIQYSHNFYFMNDGQVKVQHSDETVDWASVIQMVNVYNKVNSVSRSVLTF